MNINIQVSSWFKKTAKAALYLCRKSRRQRQGSAVYGSDAALAGNSVFFIGRKGEKKQLLKITL